jgi:hypothetical protein
MVAINVSHGAENRSYNIHKDIICGVSSVFSAAFNGSGAEWKETQGLKMNWPECDLATFDVFVHWLYTRSLPLDSKLPGKGKARNIAFLRMLVLGSRALIPTLQRQCYDRIRLNLGSLKKYPGSEFVMELYKHNLGGGQLGRYATKLITWKIIRNLSGDGRAQRSKEMVKEILDDTPEFAVEVAKELNCALYNMGLNGEGHPGHKPAENTYVVDPVHPYNDPTFDTYTDAQGE